MCAMFALPSDGNAQILSNIAKTDFILDLLVFLQPSSDLWVTTGCCKMKLLVL